MIDLSKYEKVYEWNSFHGVVFRRWFSYTPVVFLIKIGDGYFIDCTSNLVDVYEVHLNLLRQKKHPNPKMSEHFSAYRNFEVYILEQIDMFANAVTCLNRYLSRYKPNLNDLEHKIEIDKSAWNGTNRKQMIGIRFEDWILKALQETSETHGLTIEDLVNVSVAHFLNRYTSRYNWKLNQAGITLMNSENIYENY